MIKKNLAIFRFMMIRATYFRAELFVWSIIETLPFAILIIFLTTVFSSKNEIGGYNLGSLIQYYLIALIIASVSDFHFEGIRSRQIREGKIDFYLARPFSYIKDILFQTFNSKLIFLSFVLPIILIIYALAVTVYQIPIPQLGANVLVFLALLFTATCITTFISLWIVMATFWLEGSSGLEHFKAIAITLFSGAMIPIRLMPNWLQQVVTFLPFKYLYAVPIEVLQGTYQLHLIDIMFLGITITTMFFITKVFWKKALIQYSSAN